MSCTSLVEKGSEKKKGYLEINERLCDNVSNASNLGSQQQLIEHRDT